MNYGQNALVNANKTVGGVNLEDSSSPYVFDLRHQYVPIQPVMQQAIAQQQQTIPVAPSLDMLWSRALQRISRSPLAYDPNMFADTAALVLQTFGMNSQSYATLVEWAQSYGHAAQHNMMQPEQIEQQIQQQVGTPYIAGCNKGNVPKGLLHK